MIESSLAPKLTFIHNGKITVNLRILFVYCLWIRYACDQEIMLEDFLVVFDFYQFI